MKLKELRSTTETFQGPQINFNNYSVAAMQFQDWSPAWLQLINSLWICGR